MDRRIILVWYTRLQRTIHDFCPPPHTARCASLVAGMQSIKLFAKLRPRERLVSVPLCYAKHLVACANL